MIDENKQKAISFYRPPITRNQIPERDALSLEDVYDYLLNDETAKRRTKEIRKTISDGGAPKPLKQNNLDFVTFGGVYDYRSTDETKLKGKNKKGLLSPSGYIVVDIDHVSEIGRDLNELRTELLQDSEIGLRLLFVSPSGDGLKLVCKTLWGFTDNETYKSEYFSLIGYLHETYNLPYRDDKQGIEGLDLTSDITRTCFLCHDDNAVLRDDNSVFNSDSHIHTEDEIKSEIKGEQVERPKYQRVQTSESYDIDYKDKLELFKRDELIPAIFTRVPEIFPSMSFAWSGNSWNSPYKLDGSKPKSPRRDKTRILQNKPFGVLEQGGGAVGVIDYYMQRNGIDFRGAFNELCKICGLTPPAPPENEKNSYNYSFKMKDKKNIVQSEKDAKNAEKIANRYKLPKEGELWEDLARDPQGFFTSYELGQDNPEPLVIPREGVTMICGLSSHGKSTLLRNLALQYVEDKKTDGDVLFFTLEESERKTRLRLLNTYIGRKLSRGHNLDRIREYARTRDTQYISNEEKGIFLRKSKEFETFLTTGRLRIYTDLVTSLELTEFLRDFASKRTIKAVFVDYIQRLDSGRKHAEKTEELEKVVEDLQDFTKDTQIPILAAAQLNRLASSPSNMGSNNIAGSADLTRYAETIICLWNSSKPEDITDKNYASSEDGIRISKLGFTPGVSGKVYIKVTKNKEGESGIDGVFDFDGNTERITSSDLPSGNVTRKQEKKLWGK